MNIQWLLPGLLFLSLAAQAAPLDFYAGAYASRVEMKGDAGPASVQQKDLQQNLGYQNTNLLVFFIGLEHQRAGWPNVRLRHTHLGESARQVNVVKPVGSPMTMTVDIDSKLIMDMTDLLFYYAPVKTAAAQLDWGFGVRRLSVDLSLDIDLTREVSLPPPMGSTTHTSIVESPHPIEFKPIFYVGGRANLPLQGMYVRSETFASAYKDRRMLDTRIGLGARNPAGVGFELGYSYQLHKFSKDDLVDIDMSMGGSYVALTWQY